MDNADIPPPDASSPPSCFALIAAEGDALCAAGVLLLHYPAARVVVAHPRNLARLLTQVAAKFGSGHPVRTASRRIRQTDPVPLPMAKMVHLVGLFPAEDPDLLKKSFDACRGAGIDPTWHDGRGVLDGKTRRTLERICGINAPRGTKTHAEAVAQGLGVEQPRAEWLRRVVAFVQPPESAPSRRTSSNPEWPENADYAAALLEYAVYAPDAADFTRRLHHWAVDGLRDESLLSRWRGDGRPLDFDGHSPQIFALRERIARIAPYEDATVLVLGPSGAGKEVAASLVHRLSGRAGPFVAVNCATLAGEAGMVNARLFGYAKGAFTGAVKEGRGVFEAAEGGTLLLDEVAELPLDTQARFLCVLEEGSYARLGEEHRMRRAHVRIIAATHRDLGAMVREHRFRDDLLFRLNVLQLYVPALSERLQDIEDLAYTLHARLGRKHHRTFPPLRPEHVAVLQASDWPGNVRQLRTILERALLLGMLDELSTLIDEERRLYAGEATAKNPSSSPLPWNPKPKKETDLLPLREANRRYVDHAVRLMEGNISRTAKALGISVNRLKRISGERRE